GAAEQAEKPDSGLTLEPDAESEGVREWLDSLPSGGGRAAAFDTRIDLAAVLTGRAGKGIAKKLRKHGFELVADPESFLVDKQSALEPGEEERAEQWGRSLAQQVASGSEEVR
ncbi:MAG: flavodoxin, partial [Rhodococcus sp. (in: high G+C Gram-positive bacteria)]|nr:flavodoxin [Rhodococcus sp. (in: high G+C Gram-positive bacteria)]MDX5451299.1 flavodoxin [Rhodococcus sp. (in: high G+C Gram-positive bacteria)]